MINARPLTYVYDDTEGYSYPLCPSHLLCGRRITTTPNNFHYEVVSTQEALTRRAKHHRTLIRHFIIRWKKDYLLNLREYHSVKRKIRACQTVEVGDVVVLKNDCTKCTFWKLAIVKSLIEGGGGGGVVRAAVVSVANPDGPPRTLKRSVKNLYPLELRTNSQDTVSTPFTTKDSEIDKDKELVEGNQVPSNREARPRRVAAVTGEMLRRLQHQH